MCPSGGVVLPMREQDGGVMIVYGRGGVLDYTGVTVWDDGTCGKPRLAKQGRCDGVAPYCRIYQQFALLPCCLSAWRQGELSAPLQRPPPIVSAARPIRKREMQRQCNESWAIANACKIRATDTVGRTYRRTRGKAAEDQSGSSRADRRGLYTVSPQARPCAGT